MSYSARFNQSHVQHVLLWDQLVIKDYFPEGRSGLYTADIRGENISNSIRQLGTGIIFGIPREWVGHRRTSFGYFDLNSLSIQIRDIEDSGNFEIGSNVISLNRNETHRDIQWVSIIPGVNTFVLYTTADHPNELNILHYEISAGNFYTGQTIQKRVIDRAIIHRNGLNPLAAGKTNVGNIAVVSTEQEYPEAIWFDTSGENSLYSRTSVLPQGINTRNTCVEFLNNSICFVRGEQGIDSTNQVSIGAGRSIVNMNLEETCLGEDIELLSTCRADDNVISVLMRTPNNMRHRIYDIPDISAGGMTTSVFSNEELTGRIRREAREALERALKEEMFTKKTVSKRKKKWKSIYAHLQKIGPGIHQDRETFFSAYISKHAGKVISDILKKKINDGNVGVVIRPKNKMIVIIEGSVGKIARFTIKKDMWNKAFVEKAKVSACLEANKKLKILRLLTLR